MWALLGLAVVALSLPAGALMPRRDVLNVFAPLLVSTSVDSQQQQQQQQQQ
eukprot:CAMPEP_0171940228 /NCGR_PEP_ID=MMETSP0993-20121228/36865_1 /TAXON_ID=483369 /ORGANISM="non described non described, Strain CCMP2098" /LENGTH=50 /DNA_ID=CAMNT_0012582199 /DNA_START=97 /DNA_END=246 /DNA_ORIENTATION=+